MSYWKYEIVHDYNATQLIKEFREENLHLKNSPGTEDEELDFIMYAEKDNHSISLGKVLLIKMSDAMVDYYKDYKGSVNLTDYWAEFIYEQNKNNETFWFKEDEIAKAFLDSIKLQTKLLYNTTALEVQNYLKTITESITTKFREDERFSREQWDPTLKSKEYLFAQPENAINYFIQKCDSLCKVLKKFRDMLDLFGSLTIKGKKISIETIQNIIKAIDEQIKSIGNFKKWLTLNRARAKLMLPFLCGVWNGLVEFIAGFVDIAILAINITISDLLGAETNLEFLEIREGVEEALGAILKDPGKIFNEAIDAIEKYKESRYDDPKLNKYQISHNLGEDLILSIDIVVTVVTIAKGLIKLSKLLPKFTKWIDAVLGRNGRKFVRGRIVFGEVTKTIMKKLMPEEFFEALKKMGKSEDNILEYYTKYHNENDFRFLNEIDEILVKNKNLTKTDAYTLWSYTTNHYYGDLNNRLRNGINTSNTKEIARLLTNALEKMPKYNGTAFRALEFSDDDLLESFLNKHSKGKTVEYNDFVSCGSNTEAAFFDKPKKNVFLKMEVKNAPIISDFADGIKIRGYAKDELLLERGRKFEIKDYKEVNNKHYFELIEK